jgi:EpsI family protein
VKGGLLGRSLLLTGCFLATAAYASHAMRAEEIPLLQPLRDLPRTLDRWQGRDEPALASNILDVLGVDQYVNRTYHAPGEPFVSLYVGYYQSQREGDTMHSPLNCLPGAGWQPVDTERMTLTLPGDTDPVTINRFVVQKGIDRAVVLYWYQSHGRVVASEYASKFYLVYDAFRSNRSDGALVRIVSPVVPGERDEDAERRATEFVHALFPNLRTHLP